MDLSALPVTFEAVIPEAYLDEMGHMNVMWYTHLFSGSVDGLFRLVGLTREYFESSHAGTFALEQHVRFIKEVRVGQRVIIRTRVLGRSAKCFHFINFMSHADSGALAATEEGIGAHVDLRLRRTAPMPPAIAAAFDELLAEHQRLPWAAPVCGVMRV
jgi:acyl-CoA thioester hydrolase